MLDDHRALEPPDPFPNSEVKRRIADGSVGSPHVRVGHRQAPIPKPLVSDDQGFCFCARKKACFLASFLDCECRRRLSQLPWKLPILHETDGRLPPPGGSKTRSRGPPRPSVKGWSPCVSRLLGVWQGFSQGLRKNVGRLMAFHPTVTFLS